MAGGITLPLTQQRDAADLSALCLHVLSLDVVWTDHLRLGFDDEDRGELVELGRTLALEFRQVQDKRGIIEEIAKSADRALRHDPALRLEIIETVPPGANIRAPFFSVISRADQVLYAEGPAELHRLEAEIARLTDGKTKGVHADFSKRMRGALMVIASSLLIALGHASGDPSYAATTQTYAGPLFALGLAMLWDDADE